MHGLLGQKGMATVADQIRRKATNIYNSRVPGPGYPENRQDSTYAT